VEGWNIGYKKNKYSSMVPLFQYSNVLLFYHFIDNFAGNVILFDNIFPCLIPPPCLPQAPNRSGTGQAGTGGGIGRGGER
jgi:hypothetical protein